MFMCAVIYLVSQSHLPFCRLPGSSVYVDSPAKNTGVDYHALLQEIFPTQGSNPGLPHLLWTLYHLSHKGSPRILEWAAYPFFRETSLPRAFLHCGQILYQLRYYKQIFIVVLLIRSHPKHTSAMWKCTQNVVHPYNGILLSNNTVNHWSKTIWLHL